MEGSLEQIIGRACGEYLPRVSFASYQGSRQPVNMFDLLSSRRKELQKIISMLNGRIGYLEK